MERLIYVCDLCGVQQETTNHWFSVGITWGRHLNGGPTLTIGKLKATYAKHVSQIWHLCGEQCVLRKVSDFLSTALAESLASAANETAHSIPGEGGNA